MSNPKKLISARKQQHGDWIEQSLFANQLKEVLRASKNWSALSEGQKEALDMIATKISRIVTGDPTHEDHWDDIAGYALLGKGEPQ